MNSSYKELLRQRAELEQQIKEAHRRELATIVAQVRDMIREYDLTVQDVFPGGRGRGRPLNSSGSSKVAPKYCDPATGKTWTGRGKAPKWIQDKDRAQFAI